MASLSSASSKTDPRSWFPSRSFISPSSCQWWFGILYSSGTSALSAMPKSRLRIPAARSSASRNSGYLPRGVASICFWVRGPMRAERSCRSRLRAKRPSWVRKAPFSSRVSSGSTPERRLCSYPLHLHPVKALGPGLYPGRDRLCVYGAQHFTPFGYLEDGPLIPSTGVGVLCGLSDAFGRVYTPGVPLQFVARSFVSAFESLESCVQPQLPFHSLMVMLLLSLRKWLGAGEGEVKPRELCGAPVSSRDDD